MTWIELVNSNKNRTLMDHWFVMTDNIYLYFWDNDFILLLRIDPAAVIWDVSINTGSVSDCTSVTPWGGADEVISVLNWSTRVSLASVFASCHNTGAEHTRQNCTSIGVGAVASWGWDCFYINALKSAWVTGSWILNIILGCLFIKKIMLTAVFPQPQIRTAEPDDGIEERGARAATAPPRLKALWRRTAISFCIFLSL